MGGQMQHAPARGVLLEGRLGGRRTGEPHRFCAPCAASHTPEGSDFLRLADRGRERTEVHAVKVVAAGALAAVRVRGPVGGNATRHERALVEGRSAHGE